LVENHLEKNIKEKSVTKQEENKVIKYYENKLKLKTKEYIPKTNKKFSLKALIQSVIGKVSLDKVDYSSFESSLESLKTYLNEEGFINNLVNSYIVTEGKLKDVTKSIDDVYQIRNLMTDFAKQVKTYGILDAIKLFDKKQQYQIKSLLQNNILDKYKSKEQASLMLNRYWSNKDNVVKNMDLMGSKTFAELTLNKFKTFSQFNKYNTILNFLKATDFDTSYLYKVIENEATRKYSYFQKVNATRIETSDDLEFLSEEEKQYAQQLIDNGEFTIKCNL